MQEAHEYLVQKGIRPSQQRLAIMRYLLSHRTHPTADDIYVALHKDMPTLSKTTVYNTVELLVKEGALCAINIDERNVRYDVTTDIHAHFRCVRCGKIYDIPLDSLSVDKQYVLADNPHLKDFVVHNTQIYHKGICPTCKTQD